MTAFSPPADNFLNRYPKKEESNSSKVVKKEKFVVPKANQLEDPCKRYIESSDIIVKSNKSLGTDDHFKSAVCSKNLLKVCEKLMTKKEATSSNSINTTSFDSNEDDFDAELSLMNEKSRMEFYRTKYGNRRDSQSAPTSPKMERKNAAPISHNPYFTITKQEERKESSISFLTNLFGITAIKHPTEAQTSLAQKYEVDSASTKSKASEAFVGGAGFSTTDQQTSQQASNRQMTPKPHPYREMNIFSPTSM
jgi:hypothetical protein